MTIFAGSIVLLIALAFWEVLLDIAILKIKELFRELLSIFFPVLGRRGVSDSTLQWVRGSGRR